MDKAGDLLAVLAGALRTVDPGDIDPGILRRAALYHGLAPLLHAQTGSDLFRPETRARALWEMTHQRFLTHLLDVMSQADIAVVVFKGTALAYELYPAPALRPRGDTDLLIAPADLSRARSALRQAGFEPGFDDDVGAEDGRSQEPWSRLGPGGEDHDIDLHWAALNSPALDTIMPVPEVIAESIPLPALGQKTRAMSRPTALLHACLHRAQHIHSPYFIGDEAHYGGDRLIWLVDIDLLSRALTANDWHQMADRAIARGAAGICADALADAQRLLDSPVPPNFLERLQLAPVGAATAYLRAPTARARARQDLVAGGWRYGLYRLLPPVEMVRARYPRSQAPLAWLYLRRISDILLGRRL
jgi:hypothetical protein